MIRALLMTRLIWKHLACLCCRVDIIKEDRMDRRFLTYNQTVPMPPSSLLHDCGALAVALASKLAVLQKVQGFLLTHALDCADGDMDCNSSQVKRIKLRVLRHTNIDHERGAQQNQANLPGAFTAKGSPNTLIQTDRSRRHLNSNKKRPLPPRSRVGSYSLLSHNPMSPLPVVRARRHAGAGADSSMLPGM
ncbi:uncharacterized protein DAT39_008492, partial [Clarias magur]